MTAILFRLLTSTAMWTAFLAAGVSWPLASAYYTHKFESRIDSCKSEVSSIQADIQRAKDEYAAREVALAASAAASSAELDRWRQAALSRNDAVIRKYAASAPAATCSISPEALEAINAD